MITSQRIHRYNDIASVFFKQIHDMISPNNTSQTQQPIGCKWRINWFYITYNQSTVGSSEDIAMVHIMNSVEV